MNRILLLEDDLLLAMHYRSVLEDAGYLVYHDVNVESAKETLTEVPIDLVITDILICDWDGRPQSSGGLSLMAHLTLNQGEKPKMIAITGTSPSLNLLQHAENFDVDVCMEKPIESKKLLSEVLRLIGPGSQEQGSGNA